jgi:hypothetical protein
MVHLPTFTVGREGAAAAPVSGLGGSCRTILGAGMPVGVGCFPCRRIRPNMPARGGLGGAMVTGCG